jgi:hypothetical protein
LTLLEILFFIKLFGVLVFVVEDFLKILNANFKKQYDPQRYGRDERNSYQWQQRIVRLWRRKIEHYYQIGNADVLQTCLD